MLDRGDAVQPIEVKAGTTFSGDFLRNLHYYQRIPGAATLNPTVIYTGAERFSVQGIDVVPISAVSSLL